jgi:hypothetical protein
MLKIISLSWTAASKVGEQTMPALYPYQTLQTQDGYLSIAAMID